MTTTSLEPPDTHEPGHWAARVASLSRSRPADDPDLAHARDALRYWRVRRALDPELEALTADTRRLLADRLLEGVA
ncbi:hypothetical protein QT969_20820 [Rhodococcus sp. CSLK01-03]|uniref:Uncharacterized protein n=1 Tax=Rhodococcus indonesiensis TaxID=3055869 RepID=A0ABT7RSV7_9NOCA|nr:hypothetical protein [Rhodococcus indonesiensis]MDM7490734.1 hypothetical protein [Rhodococcus indonesiensis]